MDRCQFSEFTFGYCVTEDLAVWQGTPLTAVPIFPSLLQEGQPGFGYDVVLQRPGVPLFLQFKLIEQMVRGNANEAKRGHFSPPFYRMHLRSRKISDQHQSLISLEQSGNDVFYVAPRFHTTSGLNSAYAIHQVWNRSFRIRPFEIGPLPDDNPHHVTFQPAAAQWRFYSEESSREGLALGSEEIATMLLHSIRQRGERTLRDQLPDIDHTLLRIVRERNATRNERERIDVEELVVESDPLRRVAFIARQFFDCQLLFAATRA
jgi:hypothetical protein